MQADHLSGRSAQPDLEYTQRMDPRRFPRRRGASEPNATDHGLARVRRVSRLCGITEPVSYLA